MWPWGQSLTMSIYLILVNFPLSLTGACIHKLWQLVGRCRAVFSCAYYVLTLTFLFFQLMNVNYERYPITLTTCKLISIKHCISFAYTTPNIKC